MFNKIFGTFFFGLLGFFLLLSVAYLLIDDVITLSDISHRATLLSLIGVGVLCLVIAFRIRSQFKGPDQVDIDRHRLPPEKKAS